MRSPLIICAGLAAAALATGCSSGHTPTSARRSTTSATASATGTSATTSAPTASTAYSPAAPQPSPDGAAAKLVDDWSTGNRAEATAVASPAAVAALFALPFPSGYLQPRGCTDASTNPGTCTYRNTQTDGIYEITVAQAAGGWYVSAVTSES